MPEDSKYIKMRLASFDVRTAERIMLELPKGTPEGAVPDKLPLLIVDFERNAQEAVITLYPAFWYERK